IIKVFKIDEISEKLPFLFILFHMVKTNKNIEIVIIPVESKPIVTPGHSGVNCTISRIARTYTMKPNTIEALNKFQRGMGDFQ
ncbi:hypothetical protein KKF86_04525, partial [bacterium]|nr:hypothetical protein [bacterium]